MFDPLTKVSENAPVVGFTAVEFEANKPAAFVSSTVADVPETPGAGDTVPLIVILCSSMLWICRT